MNDIIEAILIRFGYDYKPISGGSKYLLRCPFHQDTKSSFTIRADTGLYGCFSCGVTGPDIKHFLKRIAGENVDIREFITEKDEVEMKLQKLYTRSALKLIQYDEYVDFMQAYIYESQGFIPALENEISREYLMGERKLTESTIKYFQLKYCLHGRYEGRVIIPYFNGDRIIGFNSRLIGTDKSEGKEYRYRYLVAQREMEGFLYNHQSIINKKYCIMVEGPFDLMYMVQNGYQNVISTLNTNVSVDQLIKIMDFEKIIFCFDNDKNESGKKGMLKASKNILNIVHDKNIMYAKLPDFKDPNECTKEELEIAFKNLKRIQNKKPAGEVVCGIF